MSRVHEAYRRVWRRAADPTVLRDIWEEFDDDTHPFRFDCPSIGLIAGGLAGGVAGGLVGLGVVGAEIVCTFGLLPAFVPATLIYGMVVPVYVFAGVARACLETSMTDRSFVVVQGWWGRR